LSNDVHHPTIPVDEARYRNIRKRPGIHQAFLEAGGGVVKDGAENV
jgi:hypothetical protein